MLPDNERDWLICLVYHCGSLWLCCGSLWLCFPGSFDFCSLCPALLHSDFKL